MAKGTGRERPNWTASLMKATPIFYAGFISFRA